MRYRESHLFDLGCMMNRIGIGLLLKFLLVMNLIMVGVKGSIHEYRNAAFIPQYNSFFFLGGNEGLYASRVVGETQNNSSDDTNNPLDGKAFIR